MDLTGALLRFSAARPHVFVVTPVGATATRLAVEAELARRGWPVADSPADTDLLVVAGTPGPRLAGIVDAVWEQVPAPRARTEVPAPDAAADRLTLAAQALADPRRQHREQVNAHRSAVPAGHGGGMEMPDGRPMADLGEDRDGLRLDRLHVSLGPALPHWPAGLVLHVVLQGDVVQQAEVEVLDAGTGGSFWGGAPAPARELDSLSRLLAVAGWDDAATRARWLRDELVGGVAADQLSARAQVLLRRVRRSRTLRWLLRGMSAGRSAAGAVVDVAACLYRRLDAVEAGLAGGAGGSSSAHTPVTALPPLLIGAEFATLRLIVAALDPDTDTVDASEVPEVHRGQSHTDRPGTPHG